MARTAQKNKKPAKAKTKAKAKPKAMKKPAPKKAAKKPVKQTIKKTKTAPARAKAKKVLKPVRAKAPVQSKLKLKVVPTKAAPAKIAKAKTSGLNIGSPAPAFALPTTSGGQVSGNSLKGKPYILYFYPKDDTSGCTAQACEFRNNSAFFNDTGLTVIGVSKDSIASHEKFKSKYNLNFELASDEGSQTCEAFGVWAEKSMYGRSYMGIERSTFLVDANGIIRAIWRKVNVAGHIDEVKAAVASLKMQDAA